MLEFPKPTAVFLDHIQSRIELHGEEKVLAIDLAVHFTGNNQVLDAVAPGLRAALFTAHQVPRQRAQGEMDLPVDEMPHLRAPALLQPLRLDCEMEGATVVVSNGIKAKTAIHLPMCKVHKVRVTAIEGGSTEVRFSVSCASGIDAQVVGALSMKQQQEIDITLVGPKVAEQPADQPTNPAAWPFPLDDKPPPTVTTKRKRGKDAGEIFADHHGGAA